MRVFPILLALVILAALSACTHSPPSFDESAWRKSVEAVPTENLYASHYRDGKYFNPWMPQERAGFLRLLKWKIAAKADYTPEEEAFRPGFRPGLKERILALPPGDFIAWIGHGTFLMRLDGHYWLTDPIFTERALLPKRVTPPALTGEDIREIAPELNVIIS
ncbi:MAG: hypothetical protein JW821_03165, partial [Deltaproteobacteria bacterium]|nr:hypothetical protein [Deltaproteobacteria bacterium]